MTQMQHPDGEVLGRLREAFERNQLDAGVTEAMLVDLALALGPIVQRYETKEGTPPDPQVFCAMANNFIKDGPRVQALLHTRERDEQGLWAELRESLLKHSSRAWPDISTSDRHEIVDEAWARVHRYLPNFLFRARLSTWIGTILYNRGLTWWAKNEVRLHSEVSIDEPIGANDDGLPSSLSDVLPSDEPGPEAQWEHAQAMQALWQRLEDLGNEFDLKILRLLYEDGYKQIEIAEMLQTSSSKITRHKQRMHERIAHDQQIQEMARQLGILLD